MKFLQGPTAPDIARIVQLGNSSSLPEPILKPCGMERYCQKIQSRPPALRTFSPARPGRQINLAYCYYHLFNKALPTVLVVRFFQSENQIQLLVDLQIAANLPIIEEAPPK